MKTTTKKITIFSKFTYFLLFIQFSTFFRLFFVDGPPLEVEKPLDHRHFWLRIPSGLPSAGRIGWSAAVGPRPDAGDDDDDDDWRFR